MNKNKQYVLLTVALILLSTTFLQAQNVGINTDGSAADPNAMLDVKSSNKGVLFPRMSTVARLAIPNTRGLLVYDTTVNAFFFNNGTTWQNITPPPASVTGVWHLAGDSGTTAANFLGTSDNAPLRIQGRNIGMNTDGSTADPNAMLDVKSSNKGVLFPRMSTTARLAIPNTKGLLVYDTTVNTFFYNTGATWQNMAVAASTAGLWSLNGNSGNADSNFLGTIDNTPLRIKVNNQRAGFIDISDGNTYWGYSSGPAVRNFSMFNTGLGTATLSNVTTGIRNTASGFQALLNNNTGISNTANGAFALRFNTSGNENVANGYNALGNNTIGNNNTAIGAGTIGSIQGSENTAVGHNALNSPTGGNASNNTAIGSSALFSNFSGSNNTAVGMNAMYFNYAGVGNTAVGVSTLFSNSGNYNTGIGWSALAHNTEGINNTGIGLSALLANTTGTDNIGIGGALVLNTTGARNIGIGNFSLAQNVTGNNNTAIGYSANAGGSDLSNTIAIGYFATVNASNKVRIGNSAITVIEGQVPFTTPSDGRFKHHIQEDVKGLDFIMKLRPVTYQFDVERFDAFQRKDMKDKDGKSLASNISHASYNEAAAIRRTGFIAQEVEKAANATGYEFSGIIKPKTENEHYSLSYESFVVPLVKAVQEQQQIIETQNKKIDDLQQQINELKQLVQHK